MPVVSSTIKDGSTLSGAVSWVATVTPDTNVSEVDFAIDGQKKWVEMKVPYTFNEDGELLSTYLVGNGTHVFITTAVTSRGTVTQASHVTIANTGGAVPATLVGTWQRTLTVADQLRTSKQPGYTGQDMPKGVWKLKIEANGLVSGSDAAGGGFVYQIAATSGGQLTALGPANWTLPVPASTDPRYGGFCANFAEARDVFGWKEAANALLISGGSTCSDRDALLDGRWTKVA
ncbi:MAG: hypothetical protein M3N95_11215 [Actinomycetota bacterium]|nr:hypothetical protein [Actinomycetota bacterium]